MELDGRPVGLLASLDQDAPRLNYDRIFLRDFAVASIPLLIEGETEIVRNFLLACVEMQSREEPFDCFRPGKGLMPASFRPVDDGSRLDADYGEDSIARVTPVDSVFWWMLVLRAYVKKTGDKELAARDDVREAMRLIVELALTARFEMYPTLLTPDGSFMIDRRMGVYGHPLEVQALFFAALRAAHELMPADEPHQKHVGKRVQHLVYHLRQYYWVDPGRLEALRKGKVDQYGEQDGNIFNIYPDAIPTWAGGWVCDGAGYFAGNVGPGRLDYRFFSHGNLLAALFGLASDEQTQAIARLFEIRRDDLLACMPLKLVYPAFEDRDWQIETGSDPKNRPWRYHNGGSWPFLLLPWTAACLRAGRADLAAEAVEQAGPHLAADDWPEFYQGVDGGAVGEQARRRQIWSAAGWLGANLLLENPSEAEAFSWPADIEPKPC